MYHANLCTILVQILIFIKYNNPRQENGETNSKQWGNNDCLEELTKF